MRVLRIDAAADVIVDVAAQLRFDLLLCETLILGGCQQASDQFVNLRPTAPHTELLVSMHAVLQPKLDEFLCRGHRDTPFQLQAISVAATFEGKQPHLEVIGDDADHVRAGIRMRLLPPALRPSHHVGVARFAEDKGAPECHEEADRARAVTWTPDVRADGDCKNA